MKLIRRAKTINLPAARSIEIKYETIQWDTNHSKLIITGVTNKDFSGPSKHRYQIEISADEFGELISSTSNAALKDPGFFEKALASIHKELFKLTAIVGGIFINIEKK